MLTAVFTGSGGGGAAVAGHEKGGVGTGNVSHLSSSFLESPVEAGASEFVGNLSFSVIKRRRSARLCSEATGILNKFSSSTLVMRFAFALTSIEF
ncbi:hypothetical protein V2J09_013343 [Rumex salicifolius]